VLCVVCYAVYVLCVLCALWLGVETVECQPFLVPMMPAAPHNGLEVSVSSSPTLSVGMMPSSARSCVWERTFPKKRWKSFREPCRWRRQDGNAWLTGQGIS